MNICLLSDKYPPDPGGLAISAQRLAYGLSSAGHHVNVCTLSPKLPPGRVEISTPKTNLTVHHLGRHKRLDDTLANIFDLIVRLHTRSPFDILHVYYLVESAFVMVYAGRYLGTPSLISARGNDLDRTVFEPKKAAHILWALAHADVVTAVSSDLARKAHALTPDSRVEVVFNGVDTSLFAPAPRDEALLAEWGLGGGPLLGFVGQAR
jgi:glycosyltransferase involved in cell wall biosynthesis